ncbi:MAG: ABC transporter ATP-binding protein [Pseudomonadota bacterium]
MVTKLNDAALSIEKVTFRFGAKLALDQVSFSLRAGQFCALLGPNGAGKSTLFNLLTRLIVSQEGGLSIAGYDLAKAPRAALSRVGAVFQEQTLDLDLSAQRNLTYFAALHGLSGPKARRRIDEALERLGIADRASEKVRTLNGGHRRRLEIARSLIHEPAVMLLDEPTVGLDAASRRAIIEHVHALCADKSLTVLWATHLVDEVEAQDRLVILHRGKLLADGIAEEIAAGHTLTERFLSLTASELEEALA